jgi:hypothetical protein
MRTSLIVQRQARYARQGADALRNAAMIQAASAAGIGRKAAREATRINSYPLPSAVLSATDAGATATISIAAHTRVYPVEGRVDVPDVAIELGSIVGLAFSTRYFVYYDDETLAVTTPVFQVTTVQRDAQVGAAAGRHFVGEVTTPADGGGGTSGSGGLPPGGGGGGPIP